MNDSEQGIALWYIPPNLFFKLGHICFQIGDTVFGFYDDQEQGQAQFKHQEEFAKELLLPYLRLIDTRMQPFRTLHRYASGVANKLGLAFRAIPKGYRYPLNLADTQIDSVKQGWKALEKNDEKRGQEEYNRYSTFAFNCVLTTNKIFSVAGFPAAENNLERIVPHIYRERVILKEFARDNSIIEEEQIGIALSDRGNNYSWTWLEEKDLSALM